MMSLLVAKKPKTAENVGVEEMEAEREFPQEAIRIIMRMSTFSELKVLRLVSRNWNALISSSPRLLNCRGVFRSDWVTKARGLNYDSTMTFKNVYFYFFPWKRNTVFPAYWAEKGRHVTVINFKYYKMPCTDLVNFLNGMPQLVDVTLNQCTFQMLKTPVKNPTKREKFVRCSCTHDNLEIKPGAPAVPPPRIRTLKLIKNDFMPLCILDLLRLRSNGLLETFHYDQCRLAKWKRDLYLPTKERINAKVFLIISDSRATIRDFSYFRNSRGDAFLEEMLSRQLILTPEVLTIGQQASWSFWLTSEFFVRYLERADVNILRSVKLRFVHPFHGGNLAAVLSEKINLRSIFMDSVWCEQGIPFDLAITFPHLQHLEEIHIRDRNRRSRPSCLDTYLDVPLPNTVRSFTFYGYYIPERKIINFVNSVSAMRLHTLMIEGGRYVSNNTFQLIIKSLPQLQVFGVNDSRALTDAGVTGLPEETCKLLIKCNQRAILTGEYELSDDLPGVPVSRMTNLTKLSLAGCRKLSDVSVFIGIKFPCLREVDLSRCLNVTDVGIIQLSKNNPNLERIVIMKNLKITHFGLNQVLLNNPSIGNIHTSKKVRDRKMGGQIPYKVCSRFASAVTYCHWDERRARPMFSD